jgi:hypothetical protein
VYHNPQRGDKHAPEEETIAPLEDVKYVDDDFNDIETRDCEEPRDYHSNWQ